MQFTFISQCAHGHLTICTHSYPATYVDRYLTGRSEIYIITLADVDQLFQWFTNSQCVNQVNFRSYIFKMTIAL